MLAYLLTYLLSCSHRKLAAKEGRKEFLNERLQVSSGGIVVGLQSVRDFVQCMADG